MADGKIIIDTSLDSSGAEKGINGLSGKLGGLAKGALVGITAATVAVGGLVKASVEQYSHFEQLTGGVDTLFKNSSSTVMKYADNAYKSAGMSANEYMSTITGFSASLLQGLGGDTEKAAQIGNMAVTDMSDNANKMGTSMENIQNAYQGFAKQNYTMLDNLKLGYGGTKTEMQRLLADAQKLTGIKYNMNNFGDVIQAIHAIQDEIGITGTTAKEASSTIEGSLNMTKSAWNNLLTGMADDNANFDTLVGNLVDSVGALGENLLPRVEIALNGVGELISQLLPPIAGKIPAIIMSLLPKISEAGTNIISSLITGIQTNLPTLATGSIQIMTSLVTGLLSMLPQLLNMGIQFIVQLALGIAQALPSLMPQILNVIVSICDIIIANIGLIINAGIQILIALIQGLIQCLPTLITEIPRIINAFSDAINANLPLILKCGIDILLMLIQGLIQSIPTLIANIPQILMAIVNAFTMYNWASLGKSLINWLGNGISAMKGSIGGIARNVASWVGTSITNIFKGGLSWGRNLISSIGGGLSSMLGFLGSSARGVASAALNAIKGAFSGAASIGVNLIKGIWNGIGSVKGWILDKIGGFAGSIISGMKSFFGIHSPSRVMRDLIGKNLVRGIGVGVDVETPSLQKDIDSNMKGLTERMQATVDFESSNLTSKISADTGFKVNTISDTDSNEGIPEGSVFILKNDIDGEVIGEKVYKVVNGKLALATKRTR